MTITIEAEGITLSMMPERGAKITSLLDVDARREWLEAPAGPLEGPIELGETFDAGDMCGWDEMMPTVAACRYPGTATELADHGDLWRMSWTVTSQTRDTVTTYASGDVLPFSLERTLTLRPRALRVDYALSIHGGGELSLLWAAHPLFATRSGTTLVLDPSIAEVTRVGDGGERSVEPWPRGGVDVASSLGVGTGVKIFAEPHGQIVSTALRDPDGVSLTMRWSRGDVRYVGIWLDNCSLSRHPVVAIEPTSGCDDALDVAAALGGPWITAPGRTRSWSLDVTLSGPSRGNR
jgi:galactose mutarotase-like enzyme